MEFLDFIEKHWIRFGIFAVMIIGTIVFRLYNKFKAKQFESTNQAELAWRRLPLNTDIGPYRKWTQSDKKSVRIITEGIYLDGTLIEYDNIRDAVFYHPSNRSLINDMGTTLRFQNGRDTYDIQAPFPVLAKILEMIPFREETKDYLGFNFRPWLIGVVVIAFALSILSKMFA